MDLHQLPLGGDDIEGYIGHRGNHVHVELPVETLLDNFHMQEPQETATESESQGSGGFRYEGERSIVQLKFLNGGPEVLIFIRINRVNPCKNHGLHLLES